MATIVTRAGKGSPLTNTEVDANFTNLNTDKAELSGAAFTGAITTNSTVDGRDVATDGTKLDTVETNADVTDATNVTAAGALMDSELTSIASVKALDQGVATTDSPTFAAATVTGEITANGGIALGDGDVATFGASDDLQIYHDTHSYIQDTGTGSLFFLTQGAEISLFGNTSAEYMGRFIQDGAVELYHNGAEKLATTSTGVDVTGNMIADGVGIGTSSPSSNLDLRTTTSTTLNIQGGDGNSKNITFKKNTGDTVEGKIKVYADIMSFETAGAERMRIDSSGNVGIGETDPDSTLTVKGSAHTNFQVKSNSESTKAFIQTVQDSDVRIGSSTNHPVSFYQNGAERMRIDSSGNVGIGTDSPTMPLSVKAASNAFAISMHGRSDGYSELYGASNDGSTKYAFLQTHSAQTKLYTLVNTPLLFGTNSAERMRIDSSGNVLFGISSVPNGTNDGMAWARTGDYSLKIGSSDTVGNFQIRFYNGNGNVGNIITSGSATSYNTSSDYRLKENVVPMTGSIDRLKALKPSQFNFIVDADRTVDGFLAHEAQEVVPEAVHGSKDAMMDEEYEVTAAVYEDVITPAVEAVDAVLDEDGLVITEAVEAQEATTESVLVTEAVMGTRSVPDMQGIDQSKLVPLLVAALQEAIARIETLENGE